MPLSDYPVLKPSVVSKVVQKFPVSDTLFFTRRIGSAVRAPFPFIQWDEIEKARGLAEFAAFDAETHVASPMKVTARSASAADIREKLPIKESTLNSLRAPGTNNQKWGMRQVAREEMNLRNLLDNRIEWMVAKMIQDGAFNYSVLSGDNEVVKSVSYGIPSANQININASGKATDNWVAGNAPDPMVNIDEAKLVFRGTNVMPDNIAMNQTVFNALRYNSNLLALIREKFGATGKALVTAVEFADLFGISNFHVYDGTYLDGSTVTNYLVDTKVTIWRESAGAEKIWQFYDAPYGTNSRYGITAKTWEKEDPEVIWLRLWRRSLAVMEHVDWVVQMTIYN